VKTKDGAEFNLGMTLVTDSGTEIPTNSENFFLYHDEYGHDFIGQKSLCGMFNPVNTFFSSHAARLTYYEKYLLQMKEDIQKDIDYLGKILEHESRENLHKYNRGDFLSLRG
jgi:hypothetical protein